MQVSELLRQKGSDVITIPASASAHEAMGKLVEYRIGALVVVDEDGLPQGIITERDFLRLGYERGGALREVIVGEVMTKNPIVGVPSDTLDYTMTIMTNNRIRHLPIVSGKQLAGIISIGDVVKALLHETEATNRYLEGYVSGRYPV